MPGPLSEDAGVSREASARVRTDGIREDCLEEGVLALGLEGWEG